MRTRRRNNTRNFLKHSRLIRLDALLTLGFDTPCFSYTLIKSAHCADLISLTKKQTHKKRRDFAIRQNLNLKFYETYKQIIIKPLHVSVFGLCLLRSNKVLRSTVLIATTPFSFRLVWSKFSPRFFFG